MQCPKYIKLLNVIYDPRCDKRGNIVEAQVPPLLPALLLNSKPQQNNNGSISSGGSSSGGGNVNIAKKIASFNIYTTKDNNGKLMLELLDNPTVKRNLSRGAKRHVLVRNRASKKIKRVAKKKYAAAKRVLVGSSHHIRFKRSLVGKSGNEASLFKKLSAKGRKLFLVARDFLKKEKGGKGPLFHHRKNALIDALVKDIDEAPMPAAQKDSDSRRKHNIDTQSPHLSFADIDQIPIIKPQNAKDADSSKKHDIGTKPSRLSIIDINNEISLPFKKDLIFSPRNTTMISIRNGAKFSSLVSHNIFRLIHADRRNVLSKQQDNNRTATIATKKENLKKIVHLLHSNNSNNMTANGAKKKFGIHRYVDINHYLGIDGKFIPSYSYMSGREAENTIDGLSGKRWDKAVLKAIDEPSDASPIDGMTTMGAERGYVSTLQKSFKNGGEVSYQVVNEDDVMGIGKDGISSPYRSRDDPYANLKPQKSRTVSGSRKQIINKGMEDYIRPQALKEERSVTKSCIEDGKLYISTFCGEQIVDHGIVDQPGEDDHLSAGMNNADAADAGDVTIEHPSPSSSAAEFSARETNFDRISSEQREHPMDEKMDGQVAHVDLTPMYDRGDMNAAVAQQNLDSNEVNVRYHERHRRKHRYHNSARHEAKLPFNEDDIDKDDIALPKLKFDQSLISKLNMDTELADYIDTLQKADPKTISSINELTEPSNVPLPPHELDFKSPQRTSSHVLESVSVPLHHMINHYKSLQPHGNELGSYTTNVNMLTSASNLVPSPIPSSGGGIGPTGARSMSPKLRMEHKLAAFSQSIGHPLFLEHHAVTIHDTGASLGSDSLMETQQHRIEGDERFYNNDMLEGAYKLAHPLNAVGTALGAPSIPTYNAGGSQGECASYTFIE